MLTWIKGLFTSIGTFLKPLLQNLMKQTGKMICAVAVQAVKEAAVRGSGKEWNEKLKIGVEIATTHLETQGLKLGVDFFINEVVAAITAAIAKDYQDKQ